MVRRQTGYWLWFVTILKAFLAHDLCLKKTQNENSFGVSSRKQLCPHSLSRDKI